MVPSSIQVLRNIYIMTHCTVQNVSYRIMYATRKARHYSKVIYPKYYINKSVPNRLAGRNKRAGGKILKKTLNVQDRIDVQGENFLENQ